MKYCRQCGKELYNEDVFCPECNTIVGSGKAFCATCGKPVNGEENCPHCGALNLSSETTTYVEKERPEDKPTTCPKCGKEVEPGHRFCPHCGELIFVPSKDISYVYKNKKLKTLLISLGSTFVAIATIIVCVFAFRDTTYKEGYNLCVEELVNQTNALNGGPYRLYVDAAEYIMLIEEDMYGEEDDDEDPLRTFYYKIDYRVDYVDEKTPDLTKKGFFRYKEKIIKVKEDESENAKEIEQRVFELKSIGNKDYKEAQKDFETVGEFKQFITAK